MYRTLGWYRVILSEVKIGCVCRNLIPPILPSGSQTLKIRRYRRCWRCLVRRRTKTISFCHKYLFSSEFSAQNSISLHQRNSRNSCRKDQLRCSKKWGNLEDMRLVDMKSVYGMFSNCAFRKLSECMNSIKPLVFNCPIMFCTKPKGTRSWWWVTNP